VQLTSVEPDDRRQRGGRHVTWPAQGRGPREDQRDRPGVHETGHPVAQEFTRRSRSQPPDGDRVEEDELAVLVVQMPSGL
jgi:hypothetical protein